RDLSFDTYSYGVVFVANICTAICLASIAHVGSKSSGLSTFGLMWCNGIICGPISLFWASIRGGLGGMISFPHLLSPGFQAVMLLSCVMACSINYCVFLEYHTEFSSHADNLCYTLPVNLLISWGPVCMRTTANSEGNERQVAA
ncbi:hypothetical protein DVH24_029129, partial [Malus domestica]